MLELFKRMWAGWLALVRGLLFVQNAVLMGIVYFLALGPVALITRATGRVWLDHAPPEPGRASYWQPRDGRPMTMDEAARPF